jgi:hypothetical protein
MFIFKDLSSSISFKASNRINTCVVDFRAEASSSNEVACAARHRWVQEFYKESGKSKTRPLFSLKRHSFFVAEVIESVWTDTGPCCDVDMTPTRTLLFRKSLFLSFGSWRTKPPRNRRFVWCTSSQKLKSLQKY